MFYNRLYIHLLARISADFDTLLSYSYELLFIGRRESALWASRASALAPSTPGRLGYNRDKPLMVLEYKKANIRQAGLNELFVCPAVQ